MTTQFNPHFNEFIEHRVLAFKFGHEEMNGAPLDFVIENHPEAIGVDLQNVCARLPRSFVEELDKRIDLLGISKRQFIELALHDALNRVDAEIERRGVWDYLQAGGDPIQLPEDEAA